jgi:hypothetical protein
MRSPVARRVSHIAAVFCGWLCLTPTLQVLGLRPRGARRCRSQVLARWNGGCVVVLTCPLEAMELQSGRGMSQSGLLLLGCSFVFRSAKQFFESTSISSQFPSKVRLRFCSSQIVLNAHESVHHQLSRGRPHECGLQGCWKRSMRRTVLFVASTLISQRIVLRYDSSVNMSARFHLFLVCLVFCHVLYCSRTFAHKQKGSD